MSPAAITPITVPMIARMKQLRDARLSHGAIAAVMSLDYDCEVRAESVSYYLQRYKGEPRNPSGRGFHSLGTMHKRPQDLAGTPC